MDDIGCWTIAEAENYVATLALHELNAVEGRGERGMWRLLPPLFRDLWDELDEKRKENVDKERRATWAMLRGILEARLAASEELTGKVSHIRFNPTCRVSALIANHLYHCLLSSACQTQLEAHPWIRLAPSTARSAGAYHV